MRYLLLIGLLLVGLLAVSCSRNQTSLDQNTTPTSLNTPSPFVTYQPIANTPTEEYRLFAQKECKNYIAEPGPPGFIINCWHGLVNGTDVFVEGNGVIHKPANYAIVSGYLTVYKNGEYINKFHFPVDLGGLTIVREMLPSLVISVGVHFEALFNLETYQWTDLNGTPIMLNPTTTIWPTLIIPTIAPSIEIVGVSLLDGDTNLPIPGFDPMPNPAIIILDSLPTKHFNLQVHTNPPTIGHVTFLLDNESPHRIDHTPPYTFIEPGEKWVPQAGFHELVIIGAPASNTTAWKINSRLIEFTVSKLPITPTLETKTRPIKK
ncbi:hypothetical protein [Herpetosiphon sp. NSE202]|uniref:hypothetical protein n=1 Tax=Herpetosiphon sp. NSE202 TaxID=3351349 RepID=UPI003643017D